MGVRDMGADRRPDHSPDPHAERDGPHGGADRAPDGDADAAPNGGGDGGPRAGYGEGGHLGGGRGGGDLQKRR